MPIHGQNRFADLIKTIKDMEKELEKKVAQAIELLKKADRLAAAMMAGITSEAKECSRRAKHGLKSFRQSLHVKNLSKHGNKSQS